jgi:formate hydrogenlyase transcriptional activator
MEDLRSDYNTFPKEGDTLVDQVLPESPLTVISDLMRGSDHNFDLLLLFEVIFKKLHPLFSIDCGALLLYDKEGSRITKSYVSICSSGESAVCSKTIAAPVPLSSIAMEIARFEFPVLKSKENWIEESGENHCPHSSGADYQFHCYIPLEINNEVLGTLELHNHHKQLSAEGLTFCCNIADLLAELIFTLDHQPAEGSIQKTSIKKSAATATAAIEPETVQKEYQLLLALCNSIAAIRSKEELVKVTHEYMTQLFDVSYVEILLYNVNGSKGLSFAKRVKDSKPNQPHVSTVQEIANEQVLSKFKSATFPEVISLELLEKQGWETAYVNSLRSSGASGLLVTSLSFTGEFIGVILTGLTQDYSLTLADYKLLEGMSTQLSVAFGNQLAFERFKHQLQEINSFKERMEDEQVYVQEESDSTAKFDEIIGKSTGMQQIFKLLSNVAGSESTVLVLGETGTGKELIARAIHNQSARKDKQMVKVNCAAIPPNLIESELFGHEKGSFTGATERRIGKFELADKSTLFLDEIGELSLDLQVKLLRVLQEKEFERVGGKATLSADVRIVSATNRNLLEEVEAGRFRSDLFYRLNVFPVSLPALRDRKEDIPLLATHFLVRFAAKSGRKIEGFSQKVLSTMMKYHWPGNIRELEHLIERQVLLTKGPVIKELEIPADNKAMSAAGAEYVPVKTISENERDHIFAVLKLCNGKISGKDGAAKLLDVPATTLNSKIKRLGLAKRHVF